MKTIKKDELFHSLGNFLKSKGIELNDGSYTARIRKGCNVLSEVINTTQDTVKKTKVKADAAWTELRKSIHESTAPRTAPKPGTGKGRPKNRKRKSRRPKKPGL